MSVNKAILVGHVGADPEIRTFGNGGRCATFSLATSENWNDKTSGERREKTEWHRVVVFNEHLVGVVERFVKKGSQLYIEGAIETRKWQDQAGQDRYSTEIVLRFAGVLQLLGRPQGSEEAAQGGAAAGAAAGAAGRKPVETNPKSGGGAPASRPQPQPPVADTAPVIMDDEIAF